MNRITIFAIISFFAYVAILSIYRMMGYTITSIFAQPSQYYLLVIPIGLILFVFQAFMIVLYKAKSKWEWVYKGAALLFATAVCLMSVTSPWIYIQCGSGLQLLLNMILLSSFVVVIATHIVVKVKAVKRA